MPEHPRLLHTVVDTTDARRLAEFYRALLGLQDPGPPQDRDGQLAPVSDPMREALMRLPAEQRRALVLAVFYGYTAREVSEPDGTPVGTVKTRIRAALMRLRSELGVSDER